MRHAPRVARAPRRAAVARTAAGCVLVAASVVACNGDSPLAQPAASTAPIPQSALPSQTATGEATTGGVTGRVVQPRVTGDVVTGLSSPWSIAFLPDGDALVSQRDDRTIVRVTDGGEVTAVGEVPGVVPGGEGGLLGLTTSPDFDTDHLVYAYLTAASDNRIVRMTYDGSSLGVPQVIVEGIEKGSIHNGGRIIFGPDGMLYAGTGDASDSSRSQDTGSLNGKILRIAPDGGIPSDNPFGNLVWSYGHRNVQGLGFDDEGHLWASEFGQSTWDELNLIEGGGNYGWPEAEGLAGVDGMIDPVEQWSTDDASPSGLAVVDNQVFMAGLAGERLWHIPAPGSSTSLEPVAYFLEEYGRLRDVVEAPDGALWVLTSNTDGRGRPREGDDRILRVERTIG